MPPSHPLDHHQQHDSPRGLSQLLIDFQTQIGRDAKDDPSKISQDKTSIDDILMALHERGIGMILFIFALPMALPLPVPPGINILLAAPLLLLTAQQMIGRHALWLPQSIKKRQIKTQSLQQMIVKSLPWARRIEKLIRPRLAWVTHHRFSPIIGLAGLIMALAVCVPIPLSNTVPSLGIAIMAIGVIMRDGLAVLCGMIIGILWVAGLTMLIIFIGQAGIEQVSDLAKDFIASWTS